MHTYKLTHRYTRLRDFYGVRTELNLHQLNLICAYIQLIRFDLPSLTGAEDTISEDKGCALLASLYEMEALYSESHYTSELDFYENWNGYCDAELSKHEFEIIGCAKPNVYSAIILTLINDCQESLQKIYESSFTDDFTLIKLLKENILRLTCILKGNPVEPAWKWCSIDGKSLDGRVFVRNDGSRDLPSNLFV